MNPWIVVGIVAGGILLFYGLLLVVRARVTLELKDEFSLTIWLFGIPIRIIPWKERKEKKYRLGRYTLRKIKKREERAARKAEKRRLKKLREEQEKKKKKKKEKSQPAKKEEQGSFSFSDLWAILQKIADSTPSVTDLVPLLCRVVKLFSSRFFGRVHIKVARLHIRVGASDAMQTAVLFGVINQSVQYLVAFLQKICRVRGLRRADIQIYPDFLTEETKVEFKITLGVSLGAVILAFLRAAWYLVRGYLRIRPTASHPKHSIFPSLPPLPTIPSAPPPPNSPVEPD